jgi:hypothetical protein
MFLQPNSNVNVGFCHEINFFSEYLVTMWKFETDNNRPCQNIGDSVETSLNI